MLRNFLSAQADKKPNSRNNLLCLATREANSLEYAITKISLCDDLVALECQI